MLMSLRILSGSHLSPVWRCAHVEPDSCAAEPGISLAVGHHASILREIRDDCVRVACSRPAISSKRFRFALKLFRLDLGPELSNLPLVRCSALLEMLTRLKAAYCSSVELPTSNLPSEERRHHRALARRLYLYGEVSSRAACPLEPRSGEGPLREPTLLRRSEQRQRDRIGR
jgi:hypothetical protein